MPEAFSINGQVVEKGENRTVILNSYELHTKTKLEIPVHVHRAKEPGPSVLLCAGMHGEETNGIEIIRKVISRDEVRNLNCGTLVAIPVINVISFLYGSRDLPDGRDHFAVNSTFTVSPPRTSIVRSFGSFPSRPGPGFGRKVIV